MKKEKTEGEKVYCMVYPSRICSRGSSFFHMSLPTQDKNQCDSGGLA
jgi:hypothetical protein